MIRIVHTADLHLGATLPRGLIGRDIEEGRRNDFHRSFQEIVTKAIEVNADLLLISGDVFHNSSPSPKDFTQFCNELGKLNDAGVKTVAIAGNHDKPKVRGGRNPMEGLIGAKAPNFTYVQTLQDEPIRLKAKDGSTIGIAPIPYLDPKAVERAGKNYSQFIAEQSEKMLKKLKNADFKVLASHLMVQGAHFKDLFPWFKEEPQVRLRDLEGYDYIALGHVHTSQKMSENAYYPGSTERVSFTERDEEKSFLIVEYEGEIKVEKVKLNCRPMISKKLTLTGSTDPTKIVIDVLRGLEAAPDGLLELEIEADQSTLSMIRSSKLEQEALKKFHAYTVKRKPQGSSTFLGKTEETGGHMMTIRNYVLSYIDSLSGYDADVKARAKEIAKEIMDRMGVI